MSDSSDKPIETTPSGALRYKLYSQDGRFIEMTCQDTPDMRRFVRWTRRFDRYTTEGHESSAGGR